MVEAWAITLEVIFASVAFTLFFLEFFIVVLMSCNQRLWTSIGQNIVLRSVWIKIALEHADVTHVHTLRNFLMVLRFQCSSCITIIIFASGFILAEVSANVLFLFPRMDFTDSVNNPAYQSVKLILLAAALLFAFVNFALSSKSLTAVGFFVNFGGKPNYISQIDINTAYSEINRASIHYFLGMRGFYFLFPCFCWLLGPSWLLGSMFILLIAVLYVDLKLDMVWKDIRKCWKRKSSQVVSTGSVEEENSCELESHEQKESEEETMV